MHRTAVRAVGVWPSEPARSSVARPLPIVTPQAGRTRGAGRPDLELRPVRVKMGTVTEAAGSCYLEMGSTKILCSVHGPRPDPRAAHFSNTGRLECNVKVPPFCGADDFEEHEKQMPAVLCSALEAAIDLTRFPKSVVDIALVVLEMDGDATSAAITCASMALADACIEMYGLVAACAVVRTSGGQLLVDPEGVEMAGNATAVVAFMPARGEVTLLNHHGEMGVEELQQAMRVGVEATKQIHGVMRAQLLAGVEGEQGKE